MKFELKLNSQMNNKIRFIKKLAFTNNSRDKNFRTNSPYTKKLHDLMF